MESIAQELISQAPITGAFIICVWIFLKYIKTRDEQHMEVIKQISKDCHDVQHRSIDAVGKNTEVLSEMKGTMQGLDSTMREVQQVIRGG